MDIRTYIKGLQKYCLHKSVGLKFTTVYSIKLKMSKIICFVIIITLGLCTLDQISCVPIRKDKQPRNLEQRSLMEDELKNIMSELIQVIHKNVLLYTYLNHIHTATYATRPAKTGHICTNYTFLDYLCSLHDNLIL